MSTSPPSQSLLEPIASSLQSADVGVIVRTDSLKSSKSTTNDTEDELREHLLGSNDQDCCGMKIQTATVSCLQLSFVFLFLLLAGAGIFYLIEHPSEVVRLATLKKNYKMDKKEIFDILDIATKGNKTAANELYATLQHHSLGFQPTANAVDNWTFVNAIVFSFTIVTTIGASFFSFSLFFSFFFLMWSPKWSLMIESNDGHG